MNAALTDSEESPRGNPSGFFRGWIEDGHRLEIAKTFAEQLGTTVQLKLVVLFELIHQRRDLVFGHRQFGLHQDAFQVPLPSFARRETNVASAFALI